MKNFKQATDEVKTLFSSGAAKANRYKSKTECDGNNDRCLMSRKKNGK